MAPGAALVLDEDDCGDGWSFVVLFYTTHAPRIINQSLTLQVLTSITVIAANKTFNYAESITQVSFLHHCQGEQQRTDISFN